MRRVPSICVLIVVAGLIAPISTLAEEKKPDISEQNLNTNSSSMSLHSIEGKILEIDGEFYVVEDPNGQRIRVHVGERTVMLSGAKRPGDPIRATIKKDGHALTVK